MSPAPTVVPGLSGDDVAQLYVTLSRVRRWLGRLGPGDPAPIGPSGVSALAEVVRQGAVRLSDLAAHERIAPATLSRVVSGLVEHGYLERSADPADARAALLSATPVGRSLVSGLRSQRVDDLAARLRRLPEEDRTALLAAAPALARLVASEG